MNELYVVVNGLYPDPVRVRVSELSFMVPNGEIYSLPDLSFICGHGKFCIKNKNCAYTTSFKSAILKEIDRAHSKRCHKFREKKK